MPDGTSRNVHVLFVHGVGSHSRLASLMQAYQSLRADPRSAEAPIRAEDPIPDWRLDEFVDNSGSGATPRLKLTNKTEQRTVYLYEVNYSTLAGVIRGNQPLDLTALFVGFDLAVNVARTRLAEEPPARPRAEGRLDIDHLGLAQTVQKLAGVFVAATMPILGIPSLVFRRFTETLVGLYTRFFEDIATFALDMNGVALISAHFDRTVRNIVESNLFVDGRDSFMIAAHSLGTVVTHDYLVRQRASENAEVLPEKLLTYGSPIGLVCWLWLLLDFRAMDFSRPMELGYFIWNPDRAADQPLAPLQWINVVNQLDPIATAFPVEYVALARTPQQNIDSLAGGRIHHRFIDTGDAAGVAHTTYLHDRKGLLEILSRMAGLRAGSAEDVRNPDTDAQARTGARHWREAIARLARLRRLTWLAGLGLIAAYLGVLAWFCRGWAPLLLLLPLYGYPPLTIGALAFFQRLIFSRPTKRTSIDAIESLHWHDPQSRPHRMRQAWRRHLSQQQERDVVMAAAPGLPRKLLLWLVSFTPSLLAMLLPLAVASRYTERWPAARGELMDHAVISAALALALFTAYLMAFALSEFSAHWRRAIEQATAPGDAGV
jgi:hypothetical protein